MNDSKNICRLCLKFDRKTIGLYNARSVESIRLNKLVQQVCSVKLEANEPFPKGICYPCRKKVFSTWEFVNTCQKSDKTLRKIYYNNAATDDKNADLEVKNAKTEAEPEDTKMEVENAEDDVAERLQTLRSNKKVAFIASLPLCADLSTPEIDHKAEPKKETPKLEEEDEPNPDLTTKPEVNDSEDDDKVSPSFLQEEKKYFPVDCSEDVKQESVLESEVEDVNKDPTDDIQNVTIKEEFIILENEDEQLEQEGSEDTKDPLSNPCPNLQENENEEEHFAEVKEEFIEAVKKEEHVEEETLKVGEDKGFIAKTVENIGSSMLKSVTSCPICNRVYDKKRNLYNHMKLQHNISRMKGVPTSMRLTKEVLVREKVSPRSFNRRTISFGESDDPQLQVQCEFCSASFATVNAKKRHEQLSCNKPYECLFCNTKYKLFKDFRVHMQTHKK